MTISMNSVSFNTPPIILTKPVGNGLFQVPYELFLQIVSNCLPPDICRLRLVCKMSWSIISAENFWGNYEKTPGTNCVDFNLSQDTCHSTYVKLRGGALGCMLIDNKLIAVCNELPKGIVIEIFDLTTPKLEGKITKQSTNYCCSMTVYNHLLVLGLESNEIQFLDTKNGFSIRSQHDTPSQIWCLASDIKHQRIAAAGIGGNLFIYHIEESSLTLSFSMQAHCQFTVLVFVNEDLIAGNDDGLIIRYDLRTKAAMCTAQGPTNSFFNDKSITHLDIDEDFVFSFHASQSIVQVRDINSLELKKEFNLSQIDSKKGYFDCLSKILRWKSSFFVALDHETNEADVVLWDFKTDKRTLLKRVGSTHPLLWDGKKLITDWGLGLAIHDYSIPWPNIRYPHLAHLGITTLQDYEKIGLTPEELFKNIETEEKYQKLLGFFKPHPKIAPLPKLNENEESGLELVKLKLKEMHESDPVTFKEWLPKMDEKIQSISTDAIFQSKSYNEMVEGLNNFITIFNTASQLFDLIDFLKTPIPQSDSDDDE